MSNENSIEYLNYLVRTYKSLTDMIVSTKNRLQSLPGNHFLCFFAHLNLYPYLLNIFLI